jgi:hypothetical protein
MSGWYNPSDPKIPAYKQWREEQEKDFLWHRTIIPMQDQYWDMWNTYMKLPEEELEEPLWGSGWGDGGWGGGGGWDGWGGGSSGYNPYSDWYRQLISWRI